MVSAIRAKQLELDMITRFTNKMREGVPKVFSVDAPEGPVKVNVDEFGTDDKKNRCYYNPEPDTEIEKIMRIVGKDRNTVYNSYPLNVRRYFVLRDKNGLLGKPKTKVIVELRFVNKLEELVKDEMVGPIGLDEILGIVNSCSSGAKRGKYIHLLGLVSPTGFEDDVTGGLWGGLVSSFVVENVLVGFTDLTKPVEKQLSYTDKWFERHKDYFTVKLADDYKKDAKKEAQREKKKVVLAMEYVREAFTWVTTDFVTIEDVLQTAEKTKKRGLTEDIVIKAFEEMIANGEGTTIKDEGKIVAFNFRR